MLKIVKSSGMYALASVAGPLVTLGLAPFLTHHLSPRDYGIFILLNNFISLTAGVTQLGLGSAFFRAYSYDYTSETDRRDVLATVSFLLGLVSLIVLLAVLLLAPFLTGLLFGQSSFSKLIMLSAGVIVVQNLAVPVFSWLRAENRPLSYSLLAIFNLLISLVATLLFVGVYSLGIVGSLIASGAGYGCVVLCAMPFIIVRSGIKLRPDIARGLLVFGLPLVLNVLSYWVLQVLDRYLLSIFASLTQTAEYAVAYSLGSALSIVVIAPFGLAWPSVLFSIAQRRDAAQAFQRIFRWFSACLLFAAYGLSLAAVILLDWLFPVTYHSAAAVIPVVSASLVFFGVYHIFLTGINLQRKTWIIGIYATIAAIVNLALNLVLIPRFQAMGAALATLLAYIVLALVAYIVNQRIYPIPFEIVKFSFALLLGVALYVGGDFLAQSQPTSLAWSISFATLGVYGACLGAYILLPRSFVALRMTRRPQGSPGIASARIASAGMASECVCMCAVLLALICVFCAKRLLLSRQVFRFLLLMLNKSVADLPKSRSLVLM
ncbi:MAG: hypothetical protein NVSMB27_43300 [Ktedonobacteraceae bacterium]